MNLCELISIRPQSQEHDYCTDESYGTIVSSFHTAMRMVIVSIYKTQVIERKVRLTREKCLGAFKAVYQMKEELVNMLLGMEEKHRFVVYQQAATFDLYKISVRTKNILTITIFSVQCSTNNHFIKWPHTQLQFWNFLTHKKVSLFWLLLTSFQNTPVLISIFWSTLLFRWQNSRKIGRVEPQFHFETQMTSFVVTSTLCLTRLLSCAA